MDTIQDAKSKGKGIDRKNCKPLELTTDEMIIRLFKLVEYEAFTAEQMDLISKIIERINKND